MYKTIDSSTKDVLEYFQYHIHMYIRYLYRECFAEAIGEVTKREMKLCWVGGEVSSTMFTESFLTLCGETEHSKLLACEGVCVNCDSVHACL